MSTRSARRPLPALIFLLALAVLAVVVWVRVAERDTTAGATDGACVSAPQLPATKAITVSVLNGAQTTGLAQQTLDGFTKLGFTAGGVDNAPNPVNGVATITYGPNGDGSAIVVGAFLPGATFATDSREDLSVTVTIGSQYKGLAGFGAYRAALRAVGASQTPPAPTGSAAASPSPRAACVTTPPVPTPGATARPS